MLMPEVLAQTRLVELVIGDVRRVAEHPPDRVVQKAQTDQETDDATEVAEQDLHVVLPGVIERVDDVAMDQPAEQVRDPVAGYSENDRG